MYHFLLLQMNIMYTEHKLIDGSGYFSCHRTKAMLYQNLKSYSLFHLTFIKQFRGFQHENVVKTLIKLKIHIKSHTKRFSNAWSICDIE